MIFLKKIFSYSDKKIDKIKSKKGFTLIEIMVASSIFVVVMLIVSGAIVSVISANQKSNNLRSVMDNLNLTLESMTRTIRFSNHFYCGSNPPSYTSTQDCSWGSSSFTVTSDDGTKLYTYYLSGGRIKRSITSALGVTDDYITSPDVSITELVFKVTGSTTFDTSQGVTCSSPNDCEQPKVTIIVKGSVGVDTTESDFSLETTVSQRLFDFK